MPLRLAALQPPSKSHANRMIFSFFIQLSRKWKIIFELKGTWGLYQPVLINGGFAKGLHVQGGFDPNKTRRTRPGEVNIKPNEWAWRWPRMKMLGWEKMIRRIVRVWIQLFFLPCASIFNFKFKFKFGICLAKGVKFGLLVRSLLEQNKGGALKPSLI